MQGLSFVLWKENIAEPNARSESELGPGLLESKKFLGCRGLTGVERWQQEGQQWVIGASKGGRDDPPRTVPLRLRRRWRGLTMAACSKRMKGRAERKGRTTRGTGRLPEMSPTRNWPYIQGEKPRTRQGSKGRMMQWEPKVWRLPGCRVANWTPAMPFETYWADSRSPNAIEATAVCELSSLRNECGIECPPSLSLYINLLTVICIWRQPFHWGGAWLPCGSPSSPSVSPASGVLASFWIRFLHSCAWRLFGMMLVSPEVRVCLLSTRILAKRSATLLPSLLVWWNEMALLVRSSCSMSFSLASSLQLEATFLAWEPFCMRVAMFIRIWESPSTIRGCRHRFLAIISPCQRPSISAELLVSQPINPKYIFRGIPSWFLRMPPKPASPGLPLEAPSKLSLYEFRGGGESNYSWPWCCYENKYSWCCLRADSVASYQECFFPRL